MDSYILLWGSDDINKLITYGGDCMDPIVATKAYYSYYDSNTREDYHKLWLLHQVYYDVTLSWKHYKFQYASGALYEILGHNSHIDIDCGGRIILILRKPTISDYLHEYYDNYTLYKTDGEKKDITIKVVNEDTNFEYFLDFDLKKYREENYNQYNCQIYVIHSSINNTGINHCQEQNISCHWN